MSYNKSCSVQQHRILYTVTLPIVIQYLIQKTLVLTRIAKNASNIILHNIKNLLQNRCIFKVTKVIYFPDPLILKVIFRNTFSPLSSVKLRPLYSSFNKTYRSYCT